MVHTFTAVFEQDGPWWIGYVEELPGANTQGATLEEARENLKEAIRLILEENREQARHIASQLADPNETDLDYLLARADEQSAQGKIYDLDILL